MEIVNTHDFKKEDCLRSAQNAEDAPKQHYKMETNKMNRNITTYEFKQPLQRKNTESTIAS